VEGSDDEFDLAFESGFELTENVECECADGWREKVHNRLPPVGFSLDATKNTPARVSVEADRVVMAR
jgi:hypothetical protein